MPSLLSRLFPNGLTALSNRVVSGIKPLSETPGVLWGGRPTSSAGVVVDEDSVLTLSAVFSACFRLASLQAQLPIGIYEKTDNGREERGMHPASGLLNTEFSPEQTAFTGRFMMDFWKPLFGAAVAEIGWDGAGRPRRLWPLGPWRVQVKQDETDGSIYYLVDGKKRINPRDMIYVPHVTSDGVTGMGFVQYAVESLGSAIAADRAAGRFFKNDMRPGGMLKHPGNPTDQARKKFRNEWQENHGGEKQGSVGVLWGGWDWIREAGAIDPNKAQLLESRQWSILEVARWLNVPPHWLAELGRATWSNIEHQSIENLTHVISPLLVAKEQEYDRKLLNPPRLYSKHNVNALLRGDMKTRGEFYRLMREIGAYSANKILALEDENGIGAEGDRRYIPVNWQPADDIMTGAEASVKMAEAKKPEPAPAQSGAGAAPAAKSKKPAAMAVAGVLEHLLTMLSKKECNESNRAAKKPNEFMKWMDGFYETFEPLMTQGLAPGGQLMAEMLWDEIQAGRLSGVNWSEWSASWCEASRRDLLEAMDGPPEAWPNRMTELLAKWQERPAKCAFEWTKPMLDKEIADASQ